MSNRELVYMILGTLTCSFFNHLMGRSSAGFTELILTEERVEVGIRSGKIKGAAFSNTSKKPLSGKREVSAAYGQRKHGKV